MATYQVLYRTDLWVTIEVGADDKAAATSKADETLDTSTLGELGEYHSVEYGSFDLANVELDDTENTDALYFDCGQCGHFHKVGLPGNVDCRDDKHRFTAEQLDTIHGDNQWEIKEDAR